MTDAEICQDMVKKGDFPLYLTVLFAPHTIRRTLFVIYAFNMELAKIRGAVSDTTLGQIRFEWWREALEGLKENTVRAHPVLRELNAADLPEIITSLFENLISIREQELLNNSTMSFDKICQFADDTGGCVFEIVGRVTDVQDQGLELYRKAGNIWAMCGLIRAMVFELSALQTDLVQNDFQQIQSPPVNVEDIKQTIIQMGDFCAENIIAVKNQFRTSQNKSSISPLMILISCKIFLKNLRKCLKSETGDYILNENHTRLLLRMNWAAITGRI